MLVFPLGLLLRPQLAHLTPKVFIGSECSITICVLADMQQWVYEDHDHKKPCFIEPVSGRLRESIGQPPHSPKWPLITMLILFELCCRRLGMSNSVFATAVATFVANVAFRLGLVARTSDILGRVFSLGNHTVLQNNTEPPLLI